MIGIYNALFLIYILFMMIYFNDIVNTNEYIKNISNFIDKIIVLLEIQKDTTIQKDIEEQITWK